jgi:hypothetical protein
MEQSQKFQQITPMKHPVTIINNDYMIIVHENLSITDFFSTFFLWIISFVVFVFIMGWGSFKT